MKKLVFALIAVSVLFVSCDKTKEDGTLVKEGYKFEMTVDGHTHEYIAAYNLDGFVHSEDCKYCVTNKNN